MSEKRPIAPLLLHGRQLDVDDGLLLRRYAFLDVRLHPPQHERPHRLVQFLGVLPGGAAAEAALPIVERRERVVVEEVEEGVVVVKNLWGVGGGRTAVPILPMDTTFGPMDFDVRHMPWTGELESSSS